MTNPWEAIPDPEIYENGRYIPDGDAYPDRWRGAAQAFRDRVGDNARLGLIYGAHPREAFDLFLTGGTPHGLLLFVHGGYWRALGRESWSHLAEGALSAGWAAALPSYPLCPEVRIGDITRSIARAVEVAAGYVPGPIVLAGHSAGGHLVLRMVSQGDGAPLLAPQVAARLAHVVAISPLTDLAPLRHIPMNDDWQITEAEVQAESPRRHPAPDLPIEIVVGGDERPAFLDQARWLAQAWPDARLTVSPGQHHFNIVEPLHNLSADWISRALAVPEN